MSHKLEIQITSDPAAEAGKLNPAESYAAQILEDAKAGFQKYRWDTIPNDKQPSAPTFLIIDDAEGLVSHLAKGSTDGKLVKYTMTTTGVDGTAVYSSMEMVAPGGDPSVLKDIYNLRAEFVMQQAVQRKQSFAMDGDPVDPDDDSLIVDHFVQALLQDARSRTQSLAYSRQPDDSFICESFGISETRIVLKKEFETDHSDKYSVSLEYPDGSEVISCAEVSEKDVASDLRELYELVSQHYPETYKDLAVKDAERFIHNMRYEAFLDSVLANTATPVNITAPSSGGNRYLVMDIVKAAPSPRVIARHLIDELNKRQGVLPESEVTRIRELVESTVNSIVHMKREPNGFIFTGRCIPVTQKDGRPSYECRWGNSLKHIANAETTFPYDVYGASVDMTSKTVLTRIATLIVASVLCDELK